MTISAITNTAAAPPATSGGTSNGSNSVLSFTQNFNTFLTLLTSQIKNQDPLSPMDTNAFTQQLVSFSEVEQQINTNNNLQQLIQLQTASESISALPLVGQQIEYGSATAPLENGQASYVYTLPSNAAQTALAVTDANGNVIYSTTGGTSAGAHDFVWDGQTSAGATAPNGGAYSLKVIAAAADKSPIAATVQSIGTVDSVSVAGGQATFDVGGIAVPIGQLVSVNPKGTGSPAH